MNSLTCLWTVWSRRRAWNQAERWAQIHRPTNRYRNGQPPPWYASLLPGENECDNNIWRQPQCEEATKYHALNRLWPRWVYIQTIYVHYKPWTTPDGKKPVIRKDEGLGMKLLDAEQVQVNVHKWGKQYSSDMLAASEKWGTSLKQLLGSSSFVVEFEYGINTKGYWT